MVVVVVFIKAPFRAPLTGSPPSRGASRLRPRSDWAYSLRPGDALGEHKGPGRIRNHGPKSSPEADGGDENGHGDAARRGGGGGGGSGALLDGGTQPVRMHEPQGPLDWARRGQIAIFALFSRRVVESWRQHSLPRSFMQQAGPIRSAGLS